MSKSADALPTKSPKLDEKELKPLTHGNLVYGAEYLSPLQSQEGGDLYRWLSHTSLRTEIS